jgi:hypothetical protein
MTEKAMQLISTIGDWYVTENGTYIRVFGATKAPHLLPKLIPDKLAIQEVAYQTLLRGVGASLARDKKAPWPALPLYIGYYGLGNVKAAREEGEALASYHFGEERFRRHDPHSVTPLFNMQVHVALS